MTKAPDAFSAFEFCNAIDRPGFAVSHDMVNAQSTRLLRSLKLFKNPLATRDIAISLLPGDVLSQDILQETGISSLQSYSDLFRKLVLGGVSAIAASDDINHISDISRVIHWIPAMHHAGTFCYRLLFRMERSGKAVGGNTLLGVLMETKTG